MKTLRFATLAPAFIATALFATTTLAQGPGGGGGPGGRGGFGGFGGGGSTLAMSLMPPIQEEIKATETQIEKLKELDTAVQAKRQALRGNRGGGPGGNNGGPGGRGNGAGPGAPGTPGAANAGAAPAGGAGAAGAPGAGNGAPGGGRRNRGGNNAANPGQVADAAGGNGGAAPGGPGGGNGNGNGNGGGGRGNRGGGNGGPGGGNGGPGGGNGGPGGFGGPGGPGGPGGFMANMTDEQRAAFEERIAAMNKLTKDTDAALAKILDAKQRARIAQIQLQQQGLNAFRTPDLITKLNINEDTQAQITEVLNGQGQARREQFTQMRDFMATLTGDNNGGGNNGGGGGGGGRGGRPNMQAIQEMLQADPALQAKMDAQRKSLDESNKDLETKTKAQLARLLTKKQRDAYAKMLGTPFDLAKLNNGRGMFGGPGGPQGAPGTAPATKAAQPAAAADPAAPASKSLRSRRGSSAGSNDN